MPELAYPYNWLRKVYESAYPTNLNEDQMEGFHIVMNKLSEYEYKVIVLRYKQGIKSYLEIEALINAPTKNAYAAEERALQKFKRPENASIIYHGIQGFRKKYPLALEALDLSTRTYRALIRSNIHSLTDIHSIEQLSQIRNLGNKSKEEVIMALQKHGFSVSHQPLDTPTLSKNIPMQKAIEIAICALQNHKTDDNKYDEYAFAIKELKKIKIQ